MNLSDTFSIVANEYTYQFLVKLKTCRGVILSALTQNKRYPIANEAWSSKGKINWVPHVGIPPSFLKKRVYEPSQMVLNFIGAKKPKPLSVRGDG